MKEIVVEDTVRIMFSMTGSVMSWTSFPMLLGPLLQQRQERALQKHADTTCLRWCSSQCSGPGCKPPFVWLQGLGTLVYSLGTNDWGGNRAFQSCTNSLSRSEKIVYPETFCISCQLYARHFRRQTFLFIMCLVNLGTFIWYPFSQRPCKVLFPFSFFLNKKNFKFKNGWLTILISGVWYGDSLFLDIRLHFKLLQDRLCYKLLQLLL